MTYHENGDGGGPRGPPGNDWTKSCNLLFWVIRIHVTPLNIVFRQAGTMGKNYLGLAGLVALIYIPVFASLAHATPQQNQVIMAFWLVYLLGCIIHRVARLGDHGNGLITHSQYIGDSAVGFFFWWNTDRARKKYSEPLLAMLIGLGCVKAHPALVVLGAYFVIGAMCLWFDDIIMQRRADAQLQALHDAAWEQRVLTERFRNGRG